MKYSESGKQGRPRMGGLPLGAGLAAIALVLCTGWAEGSHSIGLNKRGPDGTAIVNSGQAVMAASSAADASTKSSGGNQIAQNKKHTWVHGGFEAFSRGSFEDGGVNLYVNAKGAIETIHRLDVNGDGYVDIVFPNNHGYIERGPTWIYKQAGLDGKNWPRQELPNDSGWISRIVDLDGDRYSDLIVVNGENGVTSVLNSYVYWGSASGIKGERTELPTVGAYDVAVVDVDRDGRLDIIMPSAWTDHHNPGKPRMMHVYLQKERRQFEDASERYGLECVAGVSVSCDDLNGDGHPDLAVANYRSEFEYDTDSYVYWGTKNGFDPNPLRLPSHYALQVTLGDLNHDGLKDIVFCGGDQVRIYWNDKGSFSPDNRTTLKASGMTTMFSKGAVRAAIGDLDKDGPNELVLATNDGVEVRRSEDLTKAHTVLKVKYTDGIAVSDLNGDGRPELIASKYTTDVSYECESVIFWNRGDGFTLDRVTYLATTGAVGCTAGDLDGDGTPEIVFNNTMRGPAVMYKDLPAYVYLGSKEHKYSPERRLDLPVGGSYVCEMADLDLDGYVDMVFQIEEGLYIFPGGPDGPKPGSRIRLTPPRTPLGVTMTVSVADLNRDGYLDLFLGIQTYDEKPETMANSSYIFYGSAEGYSSERSKVFPTYGSGSQHFADVNRDGYLDILCADKRAYIAAYLGGPGGYSEDRIQKIMMDGLLAGSINSVDLNGDGWLDIMASAGGRDHGFCILWGSPDGYSSDRAEYRLGPISRGVISAADLNNDRKLDLLVSAYTDNRTRVLPAEIVWNKGNGFDWEHPVIIPASSPFAFLAADLSGNGYTDAVIACHRDDLGHQVDSLILWNGPEGISPDRSTRIPGLGPHWITSRDPGNAFTRGPEEYYVSPAHNMQGGRPRRISWDADVPENTQLKFQLRWAATEDGLKTAKWQGPGGPATYYEAVGQAVKGVSESARWLQYRAVFVSPNGCRSPRLRSVRIDIE